MTDMDSGKPDNGIKDRPKGPVARFFISIGANIVRLMGTNVLFLIFNIPAMVVAYFYSIFVIPTLWSSYDIHTLLNIAQTDPMQDFTYVMFLLFLAVFVLLLVTSLLVCVGPLQAGFAQVYKDIRSGSIVSVFGSFKKGVKENWKKGLIVMINGLLVTAVFLLSVNFYLRMEMTVGTIIGGLFMFLTVLFVIVQNYVYTLMVYTDLRVGQMYKNAFLLILLSPVKTFGLIIAGFAVYLIIPFVLLALYSYLTIGIFAFLYSFLAIAMIQYLISCASAGLIEKYVADDGSVLSFDNYFEIYPEDDYQDDVELDDEDNEDDEDSGKSGQ